MAKIWKVIGIVMSVLVIGALGFCGIWTVRNWNTVYSSFDGTSFYTYEDMQKLKQDTIEQCAKNEVEYKKVIGELRETVLSLQNQNSVLTVQVNNLSYINQDYEAQISVLTARKKELEGELAVLQLDKVANEQLIIDLNNEIEKLNKRISELTALAESGNEQIIVLSERINQLQNSVSYYENFIADLTNDTQAVTTYEVDGAVWKIEIVNKGESFNLPVPTDTSTMIFNGWTLNNVLVGNTYTADNNVKFVADITKKYSVRFMVDDQIYNQQNIITNEFASVPTQPTKDGYEFLGWSYNGVDIVENIDTKVVTNNVVYYAVFSKLHTVRFMVDGEVYTTQTVKNGACVEDVQLDTTGLFRGWLINNEYVDLSTYQIYLDTLFVADICYDDWCEVSCFTPLSFSGNGVWSNGNNLYLDNYVFNEETKMFESCNWENISDSADLFYWVDGIWTDGNRFYYSNGETHYVLNETTNVWESIQWNIDNLVGRNVWTDGDSVYYSDYTEQYELNKELGIWELKEWNVDGIYHGYDVWTDGLNIYYSQSYVFKSETKTWESISFNGLEVRYPSFENVWTDGVNVYFSENTSHFILNKATRTWSTFTWNGLSDFMGSRIFTYKNNYYYAYNSDHYILDRETHTWNLITFCYGKYVSINSENVWTDGVDIYYSDDGLNYNFILNKETNTWENIQFNGLSYFFGEFVYTDGVNYYYSFLSDSIYILDKDTHTWYETNYWKDLARFMDYGFWSDGNNYYYSFDGEHYILDIVNHTYAPITWNGSTDFYGYLVWTDGENIYYSKNGEHFVLDKTTNTWIKKTWLGFTEVSSNYIWTDGKDIYYSSGDVQYVLDKVANAWVEKEWTGITNFYGNQIYCVDNTYYIRTNSKIYVLRETVGA